MNRPFGLIVAAWVLGLVAPFAIGAKSGRAGEAQEVQSALRLQALAGQDVVRIDRAITVATPTRARPEHVVALLARPESYRRAVPAFVRAQPVEAKARTADNRGGQLLDWELEIPLWNLEGRLRLEPRDDGADITLTTGDLAPGAFRLRVHPSRQGEGSVLVVHGTANIANANWMTRNVAKRSPLATPAMAATAGYVLARALALEAQRSDDATVPQRWPRAAPRAPERHALDGAAFAAHVEKAGVAGDRGTWAIVSRRPDGRLHHVAVATPVALAPELVHRHACDGYRWRVLPGWGDLEIQAPPRAASEQVIWDVDSGLPFVDFDARWSVRLDRPLSGEVVGGDWRGPVLAYDIRPLGESRTRTIAVMSLHPHIERTGYVTRKLVEAEPLLEHGLALALGYVNAVSLAQSLGQ